METDANGHLAALGGASLLFGSRNIFNKAAILGAGLILGGVIAAACCDDLSNGPSAFTLVAGSIGTVLMLSSFINLLRVAMSQTSPEKFLGGDVSNVNYFLDLDKTFVWRGEPPSGDFTKGGCLTETQHSKHAEDNFYYNNTIARQLIDLKRKGAKIHILSNGEWGIEMKEIFEKYLGTLAVGEGFKFDSFTSWVCSSGVNGCSGLQQEPGFKLGAKGNFLQKYFPDEDNRLFDDALYHRLFARMAGAQAIHPKNIPPTHAHAE
jgi:hypothetical protein